MASAAAVDAEIVLVLTDDAATVLDTTEDEECN